MKILISSSLFFREKLSKLISKERSLRANISDGDANQNTSSVPVNVSRIQPAVSFVKDDSKLVASPDTVEEAK
jgi:hypothetical protein